MLTFARPIALVGLAYGTGGVIIERIVVQAPYEIMPGTIDTGQEVLNCQAEGRKETVCG